MHIAMATILPREKALLAALDSSAVGSNISSSVLSDFCATFGSEDEDEDEDEDPFP